VVLSSQRIQLKEALYNAIKAKDEKAETENPLVEDGQKLIPSVTRVFKRDQERFVYLQAYEQGAVHTQPLIAFVSLYRGQEKTLETQPVEVSGALNNRLNTVPLSFNIALNHLPPGEYACQVTVLDPTGQKGAFWRAPVVLLR
jgi:hypothetical protein